PISHRPSRGERVGVSGRNALLPFTLTLSRQERGEGISSRFGGRSRLLWLDLLFRFRLRLCRLGFGFRLHVTREHTCWRRDGRAGLEPAPLAQRRERARV